MVGDGLERWASSILATGIPDLRSLGSAPFLYSLKKNTHTYFYTSFVAYIFGLGLTIFIMHIFKHAQVSSAVLPPADARPKQDMPVWPRGSCIMPGKSRCIPSLGFAFPMLACTLPCPKLVCLARAESCLGQGWFRQLCFQQHHLSWPAQCFCGSLQPSCL